MPQALLDYLAPKKILLLGFGREGRSTYQYIRRHFPEKELSIADQNPVTLEDAHVTLHCGAHYLEAINRYDLVIKSPGITVRDLQISSSVEMTCQLDLFLRFARCRVVGITGTKGKTTTSTLIYAILQAAGIESCLIGNIGVPVFEDIEAAETMTAVVEMSSHQLEFTSCSPHVAVLTNLYPEHLDHYHGFAGYANAKLNIVRHQKAGDFFLCNDQQDLGELINLAALPARVLRIGEKGDTPFLRKLLYCNPNLKGEHSRQDIRFAAAAAQCLGASREAILQGIENFKGIEHRMEYVGEFKGISFYNDSIATIPHAVICAIEALENVDTLIFGGMDRGLDYTAFEEALASSSVRNLIGLPETGHQILDTLRTWGTGKNLFRAEDMQQAVKAAYAYTLPGATCLFSPAASSYNIYKNFEEKGRHYKDLVCAYGEDVSEDD